MTITIDAHAAFYALEEVVMAYGRDYVYPQVGGRCWYAQDGQPSCMVGWALSRLGVTVGTLEAMDAQGMAAISIVDVPGVEFVGDAREVFSMAQTQQDGGSTWGSALREAGSIL